MVELSGLNQNWVRAPVFILQFQDSSGHRAQGSGLRAQGSELRAQGKTYINHPGAAGKNPVVRICDRGQK